MNRLEEIKGSPVLSRYSSLSHISDEKLSEMRKLFAEIDTDGSGRIDQGELKERLKYLGRDASDENVEKFLKIMDIDGDGTINFFEWVSRAPVELLAPPSAFRSKRASVSRAKDDPLRFRAKSLYFDGTKNNSPVPGRSFSLSELPLPTIQTENHISVEEFNAMFPLSGESKPFDDLDLPDEGESEKERMKVALRKSMSVPDLNAPLRSDSDDEGSSEVTEETMQRSFSEGTKHRGVNDLDFGMLPADSLDDGKPSPVDRVQESTRRNSGSYVPVTEEKDDAKKPLLRSLLEQGGNTSGEIKRRSSLRSVSFTDSEGEPTAPKTLRFSEHTKHIMDLIDKEPTPVNSPRGTESAEYKEIVQHLHDENRPVIKHIVPVVQEPVVVEKEIIDEEKQLPKTIKKNSSKETKKPLKILTKLSSEKKAVTVASLDEILQSSDGSGSTNSTAPLKKKKRVTPTKVKDSKGSSEITLEQAWQDKRNEMSSKVAIDDDIEDEQIMEDRKALVLVGRQIGKLNGLDAFRTLTNLDLSNNNIVTIEFVPRTLRYLNLSSNGIKIISGLDHLKNLLVLNLNDNEIHKIEGLDNLFSLQELYLADNFLRRVENLEFQQQLECLDLRNNLIATVDDIRTLSVNKKLWRLYLGGNKLLESWHGTAISNLLPHLTQLDGKDITYPMSSHSKLAQKRATAKDIPTTPVSDMTPEERRQSRQRIHGQTPKSNTFKTPTKPIVSTITAEERKQSQARLLKPRPTPQPEPIPEKPKNSTKKLQATRSADTPKTPKVVQVSDLAKSSSFTTPNISPTKSPNSQPRSPLSFDDPNYSGLLHRLNRLEAGYKTLMSLVSARASANGENFETKKFNDNSRFTPNLSKSSSSFRKNISHHPSIPEHLVPPTPTHPHTDFIERNRKLASEWSHYKIISKQLKRVQKMQSKQEQQSQQSSKGSSPIASTKEPKKEQKPLKQEPLYETDTKRPEEQVNPENFQKYLTDFTEKIQSIRLAFQYFYEFCQLSIIDRKQLEEFKILLLSNDLLLEPNLVLSNNLSSADVNKLQVLIEEFQLIQVTIRVLLTLADMDESDDTIRDFMLNSASSLIEMDVNK